MHLGVGLLRAGGVRRQAVAGILGQRIESDALAAADHVEEQVGRDAVQPALECAGRVLGERLEDPDERLLGQILGVSTVARQPIRKPVDAVGMLPNDLVPRGRDPLRRLRSRPRLTLSARLPGLHALPYRQPALAHAPCNASAFPYVPCSDVPTLRVSAERTLYIGEVPAVTPWIVIGIVAIALLGFTCAWVLKARSGLEIDAERASLTTPTHIWVAAHREQETRSRPDPLSSPYLVCRRASIHA